MSGPPRGRPRRRSLPIVLPVALGLAIAPQAATEDPAATPRAAESRDWAPPAPRREPRPEFVAGRLVVKYRDSVGGCVHCLLERGESLATVVRKGSEALAALHDDHGVIAARPVFRTVEDERRLVAAQTGSGAGADDRAGVPVAALRELHRQKLAAARARFPERAARAAPEAAAPDLHHVYVLELAAGHDPEAAAARFEADPYVEYAHPDYFARADFEPNDPFFRSAGSWGQEYDDLWGLKRRQMDLAPAWDLTRGEGVVVAVVDTGVDYRHEDIADNVWRNPFEVADNGIDDDGNGFVDDVRGWDFTTCAEWGTHRCRKRKSADNDPLDDHLHGTHVAGTIAAVADNGRGIVGVAPRAKIMPVKVLNSQGVAPSSELAAGIVYAAANGAAVLNNSWGCGFCPRVPAFENAVTTADALGAVVVFSAGNSARDNRARSPQNLRRPKPIVVAANDPDDRPTFFTSFGASVDVTGPGGAAEWGGKENILSLRFKGKCRGCRRLSQGRKYMRLQGTSMSAPHASGLAALLVAHRPALTTDQVRQVLRSSSEDVGPPGFDLHSGAGRLDAPRALQSGAPLTVRIASPAHSSLQKKRRIVLQGTAAGPGFDHYQLFTASEGENDWTAIGAPVRQPVQGGTLGSWSRGDLRPGWNLLRLVATTTDGRTYEDVVSIARQARLRRIGRELPGMAQSADVSEGRVVWFQVDLPVRKQIGHVYLYDLATRALIRLTEEPVRHSEPAIAGDHVAWDDEGVNERRWTLYRCQFDAATGTCPPRLVARDAARPQLSGDHLAYVEDGNLVAAEVNSTNRRTVARPDLYALDGDLIAYTPGRPPPGPGPGDYDAHSLHVFDWQTGERRRLTSHTRIDAVGLTGRTIVYVTLDALNGFDLRAYDLDTDTVRVLNPFLPPITRMDVADGFVVWSELSDIRGLEVATGRWFGPAVHPLVIRGTPAISGREVAFIEIKNFDHRAGHLYYTRLEPF